MSLAFGDCMTLTKRPRRRFKLIQAICFNSSSFCEQVDAPPQPPAIPEHLTKSQRRPITIQLHPSTRSRNPLAGPRDRDFAPVFCIPVPKGAARRVCHAAPEDRSSVPSCVFGRAEDCRSAVLLSSSFPCCRFSLHPVAHASGSMCQGNGHRAAMGHFLARPLQRPETPRRLRMPTACS